MDRIYDPEYELKARTFNATNVCNGSNHDRNFRTTLVFWLRPERAASCDLVDRSTGSLGGLASGVTATVTILEKPTQKGTITTRRLLRQDRQPTPTVGP